MDWKVQLSRMNFCQREQRAAQQVIESEWLTMGGQVQNFEQAFSEFFDYSTTGVAVSSATAALHLILMVNKIGKGDEVIIPGLTFVSDANVIVQLGATPVFCDINGINDLNASISDILSKITSRTKAIVIVHFAGFPMDLTELRKICDEKYIVLIEDCAHSPGAKLNGSYVGGVGDYSYFSFFSNKNLATGEGGMIVTNRHDDRDVLARLRSHGMSAVTLDRHKGRQNSYDVLEVGLNYRMDEIRAAIGLVQLDKLESGNAARQLRHSQYCTLLADSPVIIPFTGYNEKYESSCHIFPIILPEGVNRNELISHMKTNRIQTSIHYPAFHTFAAYTQLISAGQLPICDQVCERELTLPIYPTMTAGEVDLVVTNLNEGLEVQNARCV